MASARRSSQATGGARTRGGAGRGHAWPRAVEPAQRRALQSGLRQIACGVPCAWQTVARLASRIIRTGLADSTDDYLMTSTTASGFGSASSHPKIRAAQAIVLSASSRVISTNRLSCFTRGTAASGGGPHSSSQLTAHVHQRALPPSRLTWFLMVTTSDMATAYVGGSIPPNSKDVDSGCIRRCDEQADRRRSRSQQAFGAVRNRPQRDDLRPGMAIVIVSLAVGSAALLAPSLVIEACLYWPNQHKPPHPKGEHRPRCRSDADWHASSGAGGDRNGQALGERA